MANKEKKAPFDPKVFLATVNGGRSISKYRKHETVFSQGKPADAVFYIQKGKDLAATAACVRALQESRSIGQHHFQNS